MADCTNLAFLLDHKGEAILQAHYSRVIGDLSEADRKDLAALVCHPIRLLRQDGFTLRIWPAEKWFPDRESVRFVEAFIEDNWDKAKLIKLETREPDHDEHGGLDEDPFDLQVCHPDAFFSYKGANGFVHNSLGLLKEQLMRGSAQPEPEVRKDCLTCCWQPEWEGKDPQFTYGTCRWILPDIPWPDGVSLAKLFLMKVSGVFKGEKDYVRVVSGCTIWNCPTYSPGPH